MESQFRPWRIDDERPGKIANRMREKYVRIIDRRGSLRKIDDGAASSREMEDLSFIHYNSFVLVVCCYCCLFVVGIRNGSITKVCLLSC